MSYSQFGYAYSPSSQLLVGGQSSESPPQQPPVCLGYDSSRLLPGFPRLSAAGFGLYPASYDQGGYISTLAAANSPHSAFYSSLPSPYDLKESRTSWTALQQSTAPACYPYDPSGLASCGPYADRYSSIDSVARRKNATRETTNTLKAWLYEHRKNPYPTKGEKIMLAIITKMTLTQVSTWFANARRRLKKENKMTWEPRNKTSEGDDRDSSSPRDIKSDDNTDDCGDSNLPDFLKQESDGFINKHSFTPSFQNHTLEAKTLNHPEKDCATFGVDCYRIQAQSSEDSATSGSPSPGHPLQPSCYADAQSRFEAGKDDGKDSVYCPVEENAPFGSGPSSRPKIWSLARTATSDSPPMIRRSLYPCPVDFCMEKNEKDCVGDKSKSSNSCSVGTFGDFIPERTSTTLKSTTTDDLCDKRSMYTPMLPNCGALPTKCETTDCLESRDRSSCMLGSNSGYATDFSSTVSENTNHYAYNGKHFKSKSEIAYAAPNCQTFDTSSNAEKRGVTHATGLLTYADGDASSRNAFYGAGSYSASTLHERGIHVVSKDSNHPDVATSIEMTESSLLRQNDH